ncbi:hypothetical protein [uncultured Methanobrevibacter sp.]|uniref:hypothetical protein n=1 Tax=uncultured Methanobrevibacter sp. TaxID=253161 RepID=UPI0025EB1E47|nr:hypothetical protein [uncultured Methanobrevibacter sp.]
MGGGIIYNPINIYFNALRKYYNDRGFNGILTISSVIIAILAWAFPDFFKEICLLFIVLIVVLVIIVGFDFHYWKKNNFSTVDISYETTLLIGGEDDNYLTMDICNFAIPSEDSLIFNLTLNFDIFLKDEIRKNSYYTLIFEKPDDLEIKMKPSKLNPHIIEKYNYSYYTVIVPNNNHDKDNFSFNLEADENTNGDLKIFFIVGKICDNNYEVVSNRADVFSKKVFSKDIQIAKGGYITIDRRDFNDVL